MSDQQCKSDRICVDGACVDANGEAATTGPTEPDDDEDPGSTGAGEDDLPALACGYTGESAEATAELNEGFSDGIPGALDLSFASNGGLASVDGVACESFSAPDDFVPGTSYECFESYRCGECPVVVGKQPIEDELWWFVVPIELRIPECASVDGYYRWQEAAGDDGAADTGGTNTCEPGCVGGEVCNGGTCECRDECVNPFGSNCCGGPFCAGDCALSPCCG